MLHDLCLWTLVVGFFLWLVFGAIRSGSYMKKNELGLFMREIAMILYYLFMGTVCYVVVLHFVPVTVEHPNGFQFFLLLLVPLVVLGKWVRRYVPLPILRWRPKAHA